MTTLSGSFADTIHGQTPVALQPMARHDRHLTETGRHQTTTDTPWPDTTMPPLGYS